MAYAEPPRPGRSFLDRFGATILRGGIAPMPATIYFYQAELGLSPQEVWFIGYILAYKWDADLPHPSLVKMAERVDISLRHLHRIKDGLVAKRLLDLVPRSNAVGGKDANGYDFTGLFSRLEALIEQHGPRGVSPMTTSGDMPEGDVTRASQGAVSSSSHSDRTVESHTHVTPRSHTYVTPASHDSEADHAEAEHPEPIHTEPPPAVRHIPIRKPPATSRVVVAVPHPIEPMDPDVRLLIERLGMDEETAQECACLVRERGRSRGYVAELVEHALADPQVRDPLKVVISNIRRNARRARTQKPPAFRQQAPSNPWPTPSSSSDATARGGDAPPALDAASELTPLWKRALTTLRFGVPADDYQTVLPYLQLLEIDRDQGWALLSAPNHHLATQVQIRLREPVQAALRLAVGIPLQILVIVPSVRGTPTLAQLLAGGEPILPEPVQAAATGQNDSAAAKATSHTSRTETSPSVPKGGHHDPIRPTDPAAG